MKKFICLDCGETFDENEIDTWEESRGEYWGVQCCESMSGCPYCRGGYVETYECDCCGELITDQYVEIEDGHKYCFNCYVVKDIADNGQL